jgi:5-dehydro-2-deoxygluconokinase
MDLMPDPPGTSIEGAERFVSALGGSAANIAVALTRQGCRAALVTRVSDDAIGRYCVAQLDRYGIDRTHVRPVGGEARNSLALSESRLEAHQTVIYRNGAADFAMTVEDVERVDYTAFSTLVTTGTVLAAEPSRSAAFRAFALAREAGCEIVFDVDYRPYSWGSGAEAADVCGRAAALSDVVVGNDVEFGVLAGAPERGPGYARGLAAASASLVVYKMGGEGALTFAGSREVRTGVYAVPALKPTGAGDAFLGTLLAARAAGHSAKDAVLHGSAAAAIVVGRVGCAPAMPTAAELDAFIAAHPGPTTP